MHSTVNIRSNVETNAPWVGAELHAGLTREDLLKIETVWHPARAEIARRLAAARVADEWWPQHLHWDWLRKAGTLNELGRQCFGLTCRAEWQGLMMTVIDPRSRPSRLEPAGRPIVYVDYIENAPWNLKLEAIGQTPRFSTIGTRLLQCAVRQSMSQGNEGRTGPHSLPASEPFYRRCGMEALGHDPLYEDLQYFEFTAEAGRLFALR